MRSLHARVILSLTLLATTAVVSALALYPTRMDRGSGKAEKLPLTLGPWLGASEPIEDYVKVILETDDVIQRTYTNPLSGKSPVQFALVFSPDNRRVAHPPEVCYRGAGWEVMEKSTVNYEGLPPMIRLVIGNSRRRDLVFYCYKAGSRITDNYYRQQFNIISNQLFRRATSSALIRFSTPIVENEEAAQAEGRIVEFARLMIPEIQNTLTD